jgi:calcium-dependent protein kinase
MGNCIGTKGTNVSARGFIQSKATVDKLKQQYDINMKVLGSGSYGKVFLAKNREDNSIKIAIKVMNKRDMSEEDLLSLRREVQIMQQVDHPNIVKYYETYDDKKYIYLCMEYCSGGDLFKQITDRGKPMTEREVAFMLEKLLKALHHCHSQNIIHRDIKPENIMRGEDDEIKFIDFGFALQVNQRKQSLDIAGTPYYIAPEVLTGKYGKECDVWSLGVCLYQLLTGYMPFDGNSQPEVFAKIRQGVFKMPKKLSDQCKDLLSKMIEVDPKKRITTI